MVKTTLTLKDFFERRQGICKIMPELTSQIVLLVKSLDPDINRIVKEFASYFKTRLVQARPLEARQSEKGSKKTETKTGPPLFPLPDESTETETLASRKGN
jgi:hypothetical protein